MFASLDGFFFGNINPDNRICGSIEIFENFWPNPENTIRMVEDECNDPHSEVYWQRAETIGQGALQQIRTNKLMHITHLAKTTNNDVLQNIHNQFNVLSTSAFSGYKNRYKLDGEMYSEGVSLLKYSEGEYYGDHYDYHPSNRRQITAICYLNNSFEGGEIEFPYFDIKIKPQPGMLILFPSNYAYRHISHNITKGTKYALVTWMHD
jgi:predicted 2-oxoglutarate/Fe(II)-dependent dioxygenase YbiX